MGEALEVQPYATEVRFGFIPGIVLSEFWMYSGVLFAIKVTRLDPFVGFFPGIKAFTAAVLGGIGNLTGALLGGLVLGLLESFGASYLGIFTNGAFGAEYKDILAFAILILILIFRPSGLLGQTVGQKA